MRFELRVRVGLGIAAAALLACGPRDQATEESAPGAGRARPAIYTVNYPLAYLAERIGGDHVDVVFPAPAGEDPAFWKPDVDTIVAYQGADLILLNGAGYAKWIGAAFLPDAKLVDTSAGFADRYARVTGNVTHTHGPGGEHDHGDIAFTTWLDLALAVEQLRAIEDALVSRWPAHREAFGRNAAEVAAELRDLDHGLEAITSSRPSLPLVFSHPVYQYVARRHNLNGQSVHWEPDEAPSPKQWRELEALRESHPATWMVWESEPLAETVEALERIGMASVVYDPCGNRPGAGDFISVMRDNVEDMRQVFK